MRRILGTLIILAAAAAPAAAQESPRAFLRGYGGVTFMSETATVYGGGLGFRLADRVELIGEAGRLTNILPHSLQRDLDTAARNLARFYGASLTIDGRAPGIYGFGALRVWTGRGSRVRLYVEGGAGSARGRSRILARSGQSDVSADVVRALGVRESETAPLLTAGGGIAVPLSKTLAFEAGYRFMRIFTDDPRINTANMSAGLRWGF